MRLSEAMGNLGKTGALVACLAGLAACASNPPQPYNQYLASWKGKSEQELVIAFGIPDNSHVMAGGSRVLEYQEKESGRTVCTTRFTISSGGRVDGWWYKGTECAPPQAA